MIKIDVTYNDLEGREVTDEFWFHLSKADLLEEAAGGTLQADLERVGAGKASRPEVLKIFKDFLARSVGEKSEDGKRFLRTTDARSRFLESDAYASFLMQLMTHPKMASEFIAGVMPKDMRKISEQVAKTGADSPEVEALTAAWFGLPENEPTSMPSGRNEDPDRDITDWRTYTPDELLALDDDLWDMIVGKVKPGMDKQLLALSIRRRQAKGGA